MRYLTTTIYGHGLTRSRLFLFVGLTTILLLALFSLKVIRGNAQVKAGQLPKEKIAHQVFSTTDGKKFSLGTSRGKIVVMQFFGTWCGYSRREVATINKIINQEHSSDLEVVGMAVKDPRSNGQAIKQFINEQKVNYSVVGEVEDKYFVDFVNSTDVSVPQILIYGRDGKLIAHFKGFNQQVGAEIEEKVKSELAAK